MKLPELNIVQKIGMAMFLPYLLYAYSHAHHRDCNHSGAIPSPLSLTNCETYFDFGEFCSLFVIGLIALLFLLIIFNSKNKKH